METDDERQAQIMRDNQHLDYSASSDLLMPLMCAHLLGIPQLLLFYGIYFAFMILGQFGGLILSETILLLVFSMLAGFHWRLLKVPQVSIEQSPHGRKLSQWSLRELMGMMLCASIFFGLLGALTRSAIFPTGVAPTRIFLMLNIITPPYFCLMGSLIGFWKYCKRSQTFNVYKVLEHTAASGLCGTILSFGVIYLLTPIFISLHPDWSQDMSEWLLFELLVVPGAGITFYAWSLSALGFMLGFITHFVLLLCRFKYPRRDRLE